MAILPITLQFFLRSSKRKRHLRFIEVEIFRSLVLPQPSRNRDGFSRDHGNSRPRLRDLEAIPGTQPPRVLACGREREDAEPRVRRKLHDSLVRLACRAFWTVGRHADVAGLVARSSNEFEERSRPTTRRGSAGDLVPQPQQDAHDEFAIPVLADENGRILAAMQVREREQCLVPERDDESLGAALPRSLDVRMDSDSTESPSPSERSKDRGAEERDQAGQKTIADPWPTRAQNFLPTDRS